MATNGAPSHTSNVVLRYFRGRFPERLISKNGDWLWPPRLPDLKQYVIFFLWGHLKQKIWNVPRHDQPRNLDQLREAITQECNNLDRQIIKRAFDATVSRARRRVAVRG